LKTLSRQTRRLLRIKDAASGERGVDGLSGEAIFSGTGAVVSSGLEKREHTISEEERFMLNCCCFLIFFPSYIYVGYCGMLEEYIGYYYY